MDVSLKISMKNSAESRNHNRSADGVLTSADKTFQRLRQTFPESGNVHGRSRRDSFDSLFHAGNRFFKFSVIFDIQAHTATSDL